MLVRTPLSIILAAAPLLLIALILPLESNKRLMVFPGNELFGIYDYTDETKGGASRSFGWNLEYGALNFRFIVRAKIPVPFANAGLSFAEPDGNGYLDVSSFRTIELRMSAAHTRSIALTLKTRHADVSRFLTAEARVSTAPVTRTYLLSDFTSPLWWLAETRIDPDKIGPPDFRRLEAIEFAVGSAQPRDVEEQYTIESIAFVRDYSTLYACLAIAIAAYYAALLVFGLRGRFLKSGTARRLIDGIPVTSLRLESRADQEAKKVFEFIHSRYGEQDLDLRLINASTGIPEAKISKIIGMHQGLSFRQYLNAIRMKEAKRLMLETDRQVTEIAFAVGYANISHFNRIFKQLESIPPTEFRKREKHGE
jgi:AraC-like DNA-binding protein